MKRSKTPSSSSGPPEPVFFVDRDLGRRFVDVPRAAGLAVEAHDDHFPPDTSDEVWLRKVTEHGWVAVTHDAKIRYTSRAREVILAAGARVIIVRGNAPVGLLAEGFAGSVTRVRRFLRRQPPPFIAKFYRDPKHPSKPGRLELWLARKPLSR